MFKNECFIAKIRKRADTFSWECTHVEFNEEDANKTLRSRVKFVKDVNKSVNFTKRMKTLGSRVISVKEAKDVNESVNEW